MKHDFGGVLITSEQLTAVKKLAAVKNAKEAYRKGLIDILTTEQLEQLDKANPPGIHPPAVGE